MNVVLLTQDDPFYLQESIDYLLQKLPVFAKVVGCVVLEPSPFGKRQSLLEKIFATYNIFGARFFFRYGLRFLYNKLTCRGELKRTLQQHEIPIIDIKDNINALKTIATIKAYNPDLLISIAGNQIFKKPLIELASKGCLNLHSSLLPKYRGLMPSFWVLRHNEEYSGVSVFLVDEGIDSGPIVVQKRLKIGSMSQQQLIKQSKKLGMDALIEAITKIYQGDYELIPNSQAEMSYFSFPTRKDVKAFYKLGKRFF